VSFVVLSLALELVVDTRLVCIYICDHCLVVINLNILFLLLLGKGPRRMRCGDQRHR
jgi:hypothetical protein